MKQHIVIFPFPVALLKAEEHSEYLTEFDANTTYLVEANISQEGIDQKDCKVFHVDTKDFYGKMRFNEFIFAKREVDGSTDISQIYAINSGDENVECELFAMDTNIRAQLILAKYNEFMETYIDIS